MYLNKIMKKYLRLCGLLKYNIYITNYMVTSAFLHTKFDTYHY